MEKEEKIISLEKAKEQLTPKAKFWNQNSLFLVFGGSFAILATAGIELFKIWAKDYEFKLSFKLLGDWYFLGILFFFLFGLAVCLISAKIIDGIAKDVNVTLKTIDEEIKRLKYQK